MKDFENYTDPEVRSGYTRLTGTLGIIVNSVLCVAKIILGLMMHSIAVVADGFHDMADSLAACITLIAAHISRLPADKKHPYGHARVEYLASLVVATIVFIVGYQLLKSSIAKCIHPEPTTFSWYMVAFMAIAIILKGSQALFTIATGRHIDSLPVIAAGIDNRNDVITGIAILAGMLLHYFTGLDLDGYLGCLVALFIIYTGIQLVRATIQPLLGAPPERETIDRMTEIIRSFPEVLGAHDIIIYNYGPGRTFASFHAEVDSRSDLMEIHAVIDRIERRLKEELNINAAGHMDPIEVNDPVRIRMEQVIGDAISRIDGAESFHDVRMVPGEKHNHIIFDVVMAPGSKTEQEVVKETLAKAIHDVDDQYQVIINFDQAFV